MFPVIRMRSAFRPEVPEMLPTPSASVVDSHNDGSNVGGEHTNGGFHVMELHITTMVGGGVVFGLFVVAVLVLYLCYHGHLQACCRGCCQACWQNQGDHRERHGVQMVQSEAMPMGERIVPVQVPVPQWEPAASAPPRALEVYSADTVRGLTEILDEHKRRSALNPKFR